MDVKEILKDLVSFNTINTIVSIPVKPMPPVLAAV